MPQPPCYDVVNKCDCPDRNPTCHSTCSKWADYVRERDADYVKRHAENQVTISLENRVSKHLQQTIYWRSKCRH